MQHLDVDIIREAKKAKIKELEKDIKLDMEAAGVGGMIECPLCHYVKNKRFSAKVFPGNTFKCFACGAWRRI